MTTNAVSALVSMLKEIEAPHHWLHASAIEIARRFHPVDTTLGNFLREKKIDHLMWTNRVKDTILDSDIRSVSVEMDPTKCKLGLWMASDPAADAASANPDFKAALAAINTPHGELHRSASEISACLTQGDHSGANSFYIKETKNHAEETLKALDVLSDCPGNYLRSVSDGIGEAASQVATAAAEVSSATPSRLPPSRRLQQPFRRSTLRAR